MSNFEETGKKREGKPHATRAGFQRRADESSEAANPLDEAQTVFIIEGSQAVAALTEKLNAARATPSFAAIGFADFAAWETLKPDFRDKTVFLIPDGHDEARHQAELVAGFLFSIADVAVITLPGGDLEAFLAAHSFDDLIGHCDAAAPWTPEAERAEEARPQPDQTLGLIWHGDPDDETLREELVEGMLPKVGLALISGQWGSYKTFVGLDLSAAVISGPSFAGHTVKRRGGVLVLAAEGQGGLRLRIEAIVNEKIGKPGEPQPIVWRRSCPKLTGPHAAKELDAIIEAAAKGMKERFGCDLALVIIDAMSTAAQFKDADSTSESQMVMSMLAARAEKFQTLIAIIDHFGKDTSTGTRNSSAKEGSVNAVLALLGEKAITGHVSNTRLALRKVKEGETGQVIPFDKRLVSVPDPRTGTPISTLVIDWKIPEKTGEEPSSAAKANRAWPKGLKIFKRAFDAACSDFGAKMRPYADGPEVVAVDREKVRNEFLRRYPADNLKTKGQAFLRSEKAALELNVMACRADVPQAGLTAFWLLHEEN